jgi:acetyltransferase
LRVESLEELFDFALAFANQPLPQGNRVAIVTNAGGLGIMAVDASVRYGLEIAALTEATLDKLRRGLPPAANIHNPVDVLGDGREDRYRVALDSVLADDQVDGAIVISTPQLMTDLPAIAATVAEVTPAYGKPALVCQMALGEIEETLAIWTRARLPHYHFPEEAARSMGAMARYAAGIQPARHEVKVFTDVDREALKALLAKVRAAGRSHLLEPEAHELFRDYGFQVAPFHWAQSPEEAAWAADSLGCPVALKIVSPDVIHKFDVGGVRLNLKTPAEVGQAYREIMAAVAAARPQASLQGAMVQRMAGKGRETILGMTRDPHFGPLVMFGLGGTYVEILKDVIFRIAPITEHWANKMIRDLKGFQIFTAYRGEAPADLDAAAQCLERLSQLVLDFPEIKELDINPLMIFPEGQGAAVLDARVFIE